MTAIEKIKSELSIEDVLQHIAGCDQPKKARAPFQCPFSDRHKNNDGAPSCVIWNDHKGIKCFGCGYKNNLFNFVKDLLDLSVSLTLAWFDKSFPHLRLNSVSYELLNDVSSKIIRSKQSQATETLQSLTPIDGKKYREGTRKELNQLAKVLEIGDVGVNLASRSGVLKFYNDSSGNLMWVVLGVIDGKIYCIQERRLDGQPVMLRDGSKVKCRTLGSASIPIGLHGDIKDNIIFCEGASDYIAAFSLMWCEGVEKLFTPIAMLGANNRIHKYCLPRLFRRNVLLVPDNDLAGVKGCSIWDDQLRPYTKHIKIFDFEGLRTDKDNPVKDLRDFMHVNIDCWEEDTEVQEPLSAFLALVDGSKS